MPGPYDRELEPNEPYTYTLDSESPYTYTTDSDSSASPSRSAQQPPQPVSSNSRPPSPPSAASSAPAKSGTSGSTDAAIDSMLGASGGQITSRMMRQLERQAMGDSGSSKLPQWPPADPQEKQPSATEQKRQKIMSGIKKTRTKDSEGGDLSFAGKDDTPLAGKQLVGHYKGEDKSVAWRAGDFNKWAANRNRDPNDPETRKEWEKLRDGDRITTRYDTDPDARETSRLKEKGNGTVERTHEKRQYAGDEQGWVMSPDTGSIHTFDPGLSKQENGKRQTTHHSSPLAGGNVAGAGMMTVKDEHITEITDESGHYRPEGEYTYQAVNEMAKRGLLDREANSSERDDHQSGPGNMSARVSLAGYAENDPRQQKGWLKDEEGISKDQLTLPYQAFLQTRGNERQARAKVSMQQELLAKVPEVGATAEGQGRAGSGPQGASSLSVGQNQSAPALRGSYEVPDLSNPLQERRQVGDDPNVYTYSPSEPELYPPGEFYNLDDDSDDGVGEFYNLDDDSDDGGVERLPGYANVDSAGNIFDPFTNRG